MSEQKQKQIDEIKNHLAAAEASLRQARETLEGAISKDNFLVESARASQIKLPHEAVKSGGNIVLGYFNGENMVDTGGKIYPVPANYASKSKLVEGDQLKLTISEDGTFIFKQIRPAPRKKIVATLKFSNNFYQAEVEGKKYNVLYASVTYFKAKDKDRVTIVVPEDDTDVKWAALDNVIVEEAKPMTPQPQSGPQGSTPGQAQGATSGGAPGHSQITSQPQISEDTTIPIPTVYIPPEPGPEPPKTPSPPEGHGYLQGQIGLDEDTFVKPEPPETNSLGESSLAPGTGSSYPGEPTPINDLQI